jgi:hypothetical protein
VASSAYACTYSRGGSGHNWRPRTRRPQEVVAAPGALVPEAGSAIGGGHTPGEGMRRAARASSSREPEWGRGRGGWCGHLIYASKMKTYIQGLFGCLPRLGRDHRFWLSDGQDILPSRHLRQQYIYVLDSRVILYEYVGQESNKRYQYRSI